MLLRTVTLTTYVKVKMIQPWCLSLKFYPLPLFSLLTFSLIFLILLSSHSPFLYIPESLSFLFPHLFTFTLPLHGSFFLLISIFSFPSLYSIFPLLLIYFFLLLLYSLSIYLITLISLPFSLSFSVFLISSSLSFFFLPLSIFFSSVSLY